MALPFKARLPCYDDWFVGPRFHFSLVLNRELIRVGTHYDVDFIGFEEHTHWLSDYVSTVSLPVPLGNTAVPDMRLLQFFFDVISVPP